MGLHKQAMWAALQRREGLSIRWETPTANYLPKKSTTGFQIGKTGEEKQWLGQTWCIPFIIAHLSPQQPLTGVSTATAARRILQDDGVVKGQLRVIYFCWGLQWSAHPTPPPAILEHPISLMLFSSNMLHPVSRRWQQRRVMGELAFADLNTT